VLTVIDPAVPPVLRTRPRRLVGTIIAGLLAALAGVVVAYALDYRQHARSQNRPDYEAMRQALEEARHQVKATLRRT
jgi:hypothetical protein